jgi:hypothetical protein
VEGLPVLSRCGESGAASFEFLHRRLSALLVVERGRGEASRHSKKTSVCHFLPDNLR